MLRLKLFEDNPNKNPPKMTMLVIVKNDNVITAATVTIDIKLLTTPANVFHDNRLHAFMPFIPSL